MSDGQAARQRDILIADGEKGKGTAAAALIGLLTELIYLGAVLGPFSLLVYGNGLTDLGTITEFRPRAALGVSAGLLALFILYGLAVRLIGRSRAAALPIALGGTAVFGITLIFLYPVIAMDVYTYAVQGYAIVFYHLNPLLAAPAEVAPRDPFIQFAGSWADSRSPYGPLWLDLSALAGWVGNGKIIPTILALKTLNALAVVGTSVLLADLMRSRGRAAAARAALLYGWNPLVLIELVGNGHNDAIMVFLLVAFLALLRRRSPVAVLFLVGSILTKYLTISALPLYFLAEMASWWRDASTRSGSEAMDPPASPASSVRGGGRGPALAAFPALALRLARPIVIVSVATAVLYAPYWHGPASLERVLDVDGNYLASIPALTILVIPGALDWLAYPRFLALGLVALWQAAGLLWGRTDLSRATFEVIFVMLLIAPHFAGWYLGVLIALGAAADDRWRLARAHSIAIGAMATIPLWAYLWPWKGDVLGLTTFHWILIPITFGVPLLLSAFQIVWGWYRRSGRDATPKGPAKRSTHLVAR